MDCPPNVAWVTNLNAPYRRPIWSELGGRCNFYVGLMGETVQHRRWFGELPSGATPINMNCVRLGRGATGYYIQRGRFDPLLASLDAIILPSWENPAAWQLLSYCKRRHIAAIGFAESTLESARFRSGPIAVARRKFYRSTDAVLTVGTASRDAILAQGVERSRVVMTHNSVDVAALRASASHRRVSVTGSHQRRWRFAYVGQLIERKNVSEIIRALALAPCDATLEIVGEGPLDADLRAEVNRLSLNERVAFLGYVRPEELGGVLARNATVILASIQEVYGLAPAEALCLGLHVVVSDRCGIASDIRGMPGVHIVPPIAEAIAAGMRQSADAWRGAIASPPILNWTASSFASDILRAVRLAQAASKTDGSR